MGNIEKLSTSALLALMIEQTGNMLATNEEMNRKLEHQDEILELLGKREDMRQRYELDRKDMDKHDEMVARLRCQQLDDYQAKIAQLEAKERQRKEEEATQAKALLTALFGAYPGAAVNRPD